MKKNKAKCVVLDLSNEPLHITDPKRLEYIVNGGKLPTNTVVVNLKDYKLIKANGDKLRNTNTSDNSSMLKLLDVLDELVSDIESNGVINSKYYHQCFAELRSATVNN